MTDDIDNLADKIKDGLQSIDNINDNQEPDNTPSSDEKVINPDELDKVKVRIKQGDVVKEFLLKDLLKENKEPDYNQLIQEQKKALEDLKNQIASLNKPLTVDDKDIDNDTDINLESPEVKQLAKKVQEIESVINHFKELAMQQEIMAFKQQRMQQAEKMLDNYPIFRNPALREVAKISIEGLLDANPQEDVNVILDYVAQKFMEASKKIEKEKLDLAKQKRGLGLGPGLGQTTIKPPEDLTKEDLHSGKMKNLIEEVLRNSLEEGV